MCFTDIKRLMCWPVMVMISGLFWGSGFCFAAEKADGEKVADIVEFDKMIHNFGDVMLSDGSLSCTFTMKNISEKPVVIYSVVTSCGCTDVEWTREPILPGKTGTISTVYTNDEGPYPFDKGLTAYISGIGKPVILRIRGIAHAKKLSLEELYHEKLGVAGQGSAGQTVIGLKSLEMKCGNLEQGGLRSEEAIIANLSDFPVKIGFESVSPALSIEVKPNPIPGRSTAKLSFTVRAQEGVWGKNVYHATPSINGKSTGRELSIHAFTKANFSHLSDKERAEGSRPVFSTNTCSTGKHKKGEVVTAEFSFTNAGKDAFTIYKADIDYPVAEAVLPANINAGCTGKIRITVDTSDMPAGEMLVTATLTTNSPSRPIINLFVTGWIF